ncbi:MAG: TadG family pilus assembly protein [Pseudomonadota bacterium]|nr:TadG family pilus assembly protein [Pseudomonadota bacterium]
MRSPPPGRSARSLLRSGSYAILFGLAVVVLLGFGALAIDVAYVRLAQMQTQDIADAASQAALFRLRRTGDLDDARAAAASIVGENRVVGSEPVLEDVVFGTWDHNADPPVFDATEVRPNAVRAVVSRTGDNGVGLFLARLFGFDTAHITREATSSTRSLHVVLVMDITGSWNQSNFRNARNAAVAFLDVLESSYQEYDMIGMTIFSGRYAWEYTPMRYLSDEESDSVARTAWGQLNVASKGGKGRTFPTECAEKANTSPTTIGAPRNNFTVSNPGGCYPAMPREYTDEPGTDHTTGIIQARTMFEEQVDPTAFRAMVVLTDGIPNGPSAVHGVYRTTLGFVESRWREFKGPVPHSTNQIKTQSNTLTQEMYNDLGVNTWVVSFVANDPFMSTMPKGIGYYSNATTSAALIPIFEDIANSLPMAIVQ